MAAYNHKPDVTNTGGCPYTFVDPLEAEHQPETKEERAMRIFLGNPERALKIFFTSYFIEKGLMWYVSLFLRSMAHINSVVGRRVVASTPQNSSDSSSHSLSETVSTATFR